MLSVVFIYCYAECHCHHMLSAFMLSVIMLSGVAPLVKTVRVKHSYAAVYGTNIAATCVLFDYCTINLCAIHALAYQAQVRHF